MGDAISYERPPDAPFGPFLLAPQQRQFKEDIEKGQKRKRAESPKTHEQRIDVAKSTASQTDIAGKGPERTAKAVQ